MKKKFCGQMNLNDVPRMLRPFEAVGTRMDLVEFAGDVTLEQ